MTSPGQRNTASQTWKRDEVPQTETRVDTFEASKVLQVKRWEVQEGPFRGFGSPPGRF